VIALAKIGEKKTISKLAARDNPLIVQMPVEPGEYELRYILIRDARYWLLDLL